jgi:ABC-type glycerol-3-phosphate transport system permease component
LGAPRISRRRVLTAIGYYIIISAIAAAFLMPLLVMVSTSLKPPEDLYADPFQWIPRTVRWQNYPEAWTSFPFTRYLFNTLYITIFNMIGAVISTSTAAYALARIRFPAAKLFFAFVIGSMLLPGEVTFIPEFIIWWRLGFVDTYVPLIAPGWLARGSSKIFLLRQFFRNIPLDLEDAAKIDGCSVPGRFFRIIAPLSTPAIGVVMIFEFVGKWNSFVDPLIYLNDTNKFTLNVGLNMFKDAFGETLTTSPNMHLFMAIATLIILPILVIFVFLQRYFVDGIQLTGIKG